LWGLERFETRVNRSTSILASIGTAWLVWAVSAVLLMLAAGGTWQFHRAMCAVAVYELPRRSARDKS
jgi:hypothetical protein